MPAGLVDASAPATLPQTSTADLAPLPRFGDYELIELLARGGMGVVYKARQISLNRTVALKMIQAGVLASPAEAKRFQAEAETIAHLQHPNIVAIHEIGQQDGQHFFSMDYVAGPTLAEIAREGPLPSTRASTYVKTIAAAVHYAHEHGILHRDLKPSNVLIDVNDNPRVTDFGLARRFEGHSEVTLTGQMLGSPNYIPPEQTLGKRGKVSRQSDVYALGAMLYHLLTGRPPFQGESLAETLQQVLNSDPVAPRLLNSRVPRDLETICLKCLEKEGPRRYPTAQGLADDLARFLEGKPIHARHVGAAGKAWKWCRRRPALAGLSAALALTLVAGLTLALWQLRRTTASELLARQHAYGADMNLVQEAVENGDLGTAMALLNAHRPAAGQKDLRGWEWRYLWQSCRGDQLFELDCSPHGIDRVAFSPDGRWLAVRDEQSALALWNFHSRQRICSFKMHANLHPFAFSAQGNLLGYSAPEDWAVSVVRLDTRQEVARLRHTNSVVYLAFSADATRMFTATEDGTLIDWNIASGESVRKSKCSATEFTQQEPCSVERCLTFSRDGGVMAFRVGNSIGLWESQSSRLTQLRLTGTANPPTALNFSADAKLLAVGVGETEGEVVVWTLEDLLRATGDTPPPRARFGRHRDWVCGVAFSPDNRYVVSAGADSALRIWELDRPEVCRRYFGHQHQILSVAWSPDGKYIVTSGMDGSVRVWDPGRPPAAHEPVTFPIVPYHYNFRLSSDSQSAILLEPTNHMAVLWDTVKMRQKEVFEFAGTNIGRIGWSSDGRMLATGFPDGNIRVWDLATRRSISSMRVPGHMIGYLEFSADGRFLLCGAMHWGPPWNRICKAWNTDGWVEIPLPREATTNLTWAHISRDCRLAVFLQYGGALTVWDVGSGRSRRRLSQPFSSPWEQGYVAFSPDGRTFACSTQRGVVSLWDAYRHTPPILIPRTTQELWDLSFSTDGTRLVVSGKRGSDAVRLLDMASKRFVATLSGEPDVYWFSRMSADNDTVYAVGEKSVLLWRAPSWAEIEAAEKGRMTQGTFTEANEEN
jgi:WD40 repeat protein/predicted Ser/Thr protein kinase